MKKLKKEPKNYRTAKEIEEDDELWDQLSRENSDSIKRTNRQEKRLSKWKEEFSKKYGPSVAHNEKYYRCGYCGYEGHMNKINAIEYPAGDHIDKCSREHVSKSKFTQLWQRWGFTKK